MVPSLLLKLLHLHLQLHLHLHLHRLLHWLLGPLQLQLPRLLQQLPPK